MKVSASSKRKPIGSADDQPQLKKTDYDRTVDIRFLGKDGWQCVARYLPPIDRMALVRAFPDVPQLKNWVPSNWWLNVPEKVREVMLLMKGFGVECHFTGSAILKLLTGARWMPNDYDIVLTYNAYDSSTYDPRLCDLYGKTDESKNRYPMFGMIHKVFSLQASKVQFIILAENKDIDDYVQDFTHTGVQSYCSVRKISIKYPLHIIRGHFAVRKQPLFEKSYRGVQTRDRLRHADVSGKVAWLLQYFYQRGYTGERVDGKPWPKKLDDFWELAGGYGENGVNNLKGYILKHLWAREHPASKVKRDSVKEAEARYAQLWKKREKLIAKNGRMKIPASYKNESVGS